MRRSAAIPLGQVPLHPLHTDAAAGPAGLARLLAAALGVGMNALRIWCATRPRGLLSGPC
jgi:hypothetical protein